MILHEITLQNFRSYNQTNFSFSSGTTLLLGPNTAGKTNILEAIMMAATGKSFRADRESEVIQWGKEVGRVIAEVGQLQEEQTKLEVVITTGMVGGKKAPMKKHTVNGVPRRMIDFVGNLRAVLFWPEDLELITDSPSRRRRYLDSVLIQVDREYRRNLLSYERGLRQRNRLLDLINEGKAHRHHLLFWDQLLITSGGYLTDKRFEYLEFLNTFEVSSLKFQVRYDKSVISESRLEQYKEEEVAAKATLVGPHRDDFVIAKFQIPNFNDQIKTELFNLSKFGSRGEQRLAVLWLKLAELAYIEKWSREAESGSARPVLLLDDIFSELDREHRKLVLSLVGQQQTIITSANEDIIKLIPQQVQIVRL